MRNGWLIFQEAEDAIMSKFFLFMNLRGWLQLTLVQLILSAFEVVD